MIAHKIKNAMSIIIHIILFQKLNDISKKFVSM